MDVDIFARSVDRLKLAGRMKALDLVFKTRESYTGGIAETFVAKDGSRSVHAFVGSLNFSHRIPLGSRLDKDWPTLPLVELLVTKLQIHDIETKDLNDILLLLAEHDLGADDRESINVRPLAEMCGRDWGLWYDVRENLHKATELLERASNGFGDLADGVGKKLNEVTRLVEGCHKTAGWHVRSWKGIRGGNWWNAVEEIRNGDDTHTYDTDTKAG